MGTVKIPIGPQHPALKEPATFTIEVDGETIVDAEVRLGYNHRGIEKACEEQNYIQNIYLTERICGICSHTHTTCYSQAVEELLALEVPKRGLYIRTLFGELERIHSHLLWVGVAGHEIGFDTLFMYSWNDRELVLDLMEMISGNRVTHSVNTIGGVRVDLDRALIDKIVPCLDALEKRIHYYIQVALHEPTLQARTVGVGLLPTDVCRNLCAVGPTARASNVPHDVRRNDPYAAYGEIPFDVITHDSCDVFGRIVVRAKELLESVKICRYIVANLPEGEIRVKKAPRKVPAGEATSRYEAPRGEDIHYVRSNGTDKPERVKVRAPTMANWPATIYMLKGGQIADLPITIAAIDPCFSCTDRLLEVRDVRKGDAFILSFDAIREMNRKRWGLKS